MFRDVRADEIELRVNKLRANGFQLLLYKDARCDMSILDETVTPMGWSRVHNEYKGNMYCGVSILNNNTKEWVIKWDAGAESKTEGVKGEASDSFKRACVNWGIGRELYTAPFVWISDSKYIKKIKDYNNKERLTVNEKFVCSKVDIVDKKIVGITIKDSKGNVTFEWSCKEYKSKKDRAIKMILKLSPKEEGLELLNIIELKELYTNINKK